MPTWIFVCIWIIWVFFAFIFGASLYLVVSHNSNPLIVAFKGRAYFSDGGLRMVIFTIASIFWIGYNVSLFF